MPKRPFSYFFLNDAFNKLYFSDENFAYLVLCFALLAIFISAIGMLGLVAYSTSQCTKEMNIRKVLGASVANIFTLICKDFLKFIFIAFVIASPIAWVMMHKWLMEYAKRVDIEWWFFVLSGFIAIVVALTTIVYHSIKAALINPIDNIRSL